MASMKRGVGYCENTDCEDYAKGVFLFNHGDTFYCPRCRQLGKVEKERGFYTGNSDIFKEVRVEYNFDPINGVYREIAIVRDESLWGLLIPVLAILQRGVVLREEAYLERQFGDAYRNYRARVPRWL